MRDVDWVKRDNSQNTPMTNQCLFYAYECGGGVAVNVNYRTQNTKVALAIPSLYHLALSADEMQFRAHRVLKHVCRELKYFTCWQVV